MSSDKVIRWTSLISLGGTRAVSASYTLQGGLKEVTRFGDSRRGSISLPHKGQTKLLALRAVGAFQLSQYPMKAFKVCRGKVKHWAPSLNPSSSGLNPLHGPPERHLTDLASIFRANPSILIDG